MTAEVIEQLNRLLDAVDVDAVNDHSLLGFARDISAVKARVDGLWMRLVQEVDGRALARTYGVRDTASLLAGKCGERPGDMRRDVEVANALAALPVVNGALDSGTITKAKAVELARATGASSDEQAALVERATHSTVTDLSRTMTEWQRQRGALPPRSPSTVSIADDSSGGVRIAGSLTVLEGEHVLCALSTAANELDCRGLTQDQRHAAGLVAVCRFFTERHENPPELRGTRPSVCVTIDVNDWTAGVASLGTRRVTGRVALLDSGRAITVEQVLELSCDASLHRVLSAGASFPLDVGRATRVPNPGQVRAITKRDRRCRWRGCGAAPWACQIHHLVHWARGGPTDLDNLVLLCWYHHHLAHHLDLGADEVRERLGPTNEEAFVLELTPA